MFEKNEIVEYYDEAEMTYRDVWHLNDCLAMHYGFWEDGVKNLKEALIKENFVLANMARVSKDDIVLDAGCGVGGSSIFLAKNFDCQVVGVTLSSNQTDLAKQNASKANITEKVTFENVDYHSTEYQDNSFTVVLAIETLEHSDDLDLFFKEAFRLLKPGGRIIIADIFSAKEQVSKNEQNLLDQWLHSWAISKLYTINYFSDLMDKNGFISLEVIDKTKAIRKSARIMSRQSRMALFSWKLLRFLGLRTENRASHKKTIGSKYQYKSLRNKLWSYAVIYAEKPL